MRNFKSCRDEFLHLSIAVGAGKMVPFAGWSMPIQVRLCQATLHVHEAASLINHHCNKFFRETYYQHGYGQIFCLFGVQYKDSIMEATTHCREKASIFDVSHMCGLTLKVRSYALNPLLRLPFCFSGQRIA